MANRLKEDEKNERVIRGFLKLPENRRCINCNSLGPQYVCTSFWTFVCTNCSGIHREFTHRVKSVSMAKFTSQEVSALQGGGNQRAKEIYFKEWDPQRNTAPDGSNVERLRDFIKHAYVDRRFSGERGSDRPPRPQSDKEDSYRGGSRSPPYEESYDRRYSDRSSSGGISPALEQDYKRSPSQPEVVNDWRREDRFGNGKSDDRRVSDGELKVGGSPERPRDLDASSPPVVRPVREILGENVIPLKIAEPPKANGSRAADSSVHTQRTASSSCMGSTSGEAAEVKWQSSASLIDFDAEPEPPAVAVSQVPPLNQANAQPAAFPSDNNWASFDVVSEVKASPPPPIVNPLDSVLSQLSVPASSPAQMFGGPVGASTVAPSGTAPFFPQQPSLFPAGAAYSTHQSGSQPWNVSVAPNSQGLQTSTAEVNPPGRKELPADLFAATYSPYRAAVPMWQTGSPYGMGYNMQYNPVMVPLQRQVMPMYQQSSRSVNPFDVNDSSSVQAPTFPSMASLQGALPNVPPSSGLMHPSASPAWGTPQPLPYQPTMPQQPPTYMPTMPQGAFMGQQMPSTVPSTRPQVSGGGFSGNWAYTTQQRPAGNFSAPHTTNPSAPVGGNPFG